MRYWDSSALVALLLDQADSPRRKAQLGEDPQVITWWGSKVECAFALNRLLREGALEQEHFEQVDKQLQIFAAAWIETQATEKLRQRALRLLRVHDLRAADALQLAAALIACEENPNRLPFLSSDARLSQAAAREGFPVLP